MTSPGAPRRAGAAGWCGTPSRRSRTRAGDGCCPGAAGRSAGRARAPRPCRRTRRRRARSKRSPGEKKESMLKGEERTRITQKDRAETLRISPLLPILAKYMNKGQPLPVTVQTPNKRPINATGGSRRPQATGNSPRSVCTNPRRT